MRLRIGALAVVALAACLQGTALAGWQSAAGGSGYSTASALSAGGTPTTTVSGRNVTVSWAAGGGPVPISGYQVRRYDGSGQLQSIGAACAGTIAGLSCTEQAVPAGQWRYTVRPVNNKWLGVESGQSAAATVAGPSLTLTPTNLTSLPAVTSGQIAGFIGGQTVSFRLDNPTTGTLLTGSIAPTPVPAGGTSTASVTIPSGTAVGPHTVYAVGSGGDTAAAAITVSPPMVTTTIGVPPWNVRDASAGATEVNVSDTTAFAGDGRSWTSQNFATSFGTGRYIQASLNSALPAGGATSSVVFNFSFSGTSAGDTTCFYFDVRSASTGAVIGTHGSAATPVDCVTGTTFKTSSTALAEVTTNAVANDLQIRIYTKSSGNRPLKVDLATVSGTSSGQSFTLYETGIVDSSTGTPVAAVPWSLYAADAVALASAGNWATSFSSTRYLRMYLPSYVPPAAVVESATFKHTYQSTTNGSSVCYYFEVYSGAGLIGTHGSTAEPVSCNSSTTVWQTDSIPLPEVNSVAAANGLSIKLYARRSKSGTSRHDLAEVQIKYSSP